MTLNMSWVMAGSFWPLRVGLRSCRSPHVCKLYQQGRSGRADHLRRVVNGSERTKSEVPFPREIPPTTTLTCSKFQKTPLRNLLILSV